MPSVVPNFLHDMQTTLLRVAPLIVAAAVVSYLILRRRGVVRRHAALRASAVGALAVHLLAVLTATRLIEVAQWQFTRGVASVDDVLLNVTGVALGYLAYLWLIRRHVHRPSAGREYQRAAGVHDASRSVPK